MTAVVTATKLLIACWATVIVLAAMALVFWRSKKPHFAVAVLPLIIPPLVHTVSGLLARTIDPSLPFTTSFHIRIVIDLIAAVVACMLIGLSSQLAFKSRKSRTWFVLCCSVFVVIFSSILILSSMAQYTTI